MMETLNDDGWADFLLWEIEMLEVFNEDDWS